MRSKDKRRRIEKTYRRANGPRRRAVSPEALEVTKIESKQKMLSFMERFTLVAEQFCEHQKKQLKKVIHQMTEDKSHFARPM